MMNKKTEQWRNAYVGQLLEKEKRELLCNSALFLATLTKGEVVDRAVGAGEFAFCVSRY